MLRDPMTQLENSQTPFEPSTLCQRRGGTGVPLLAARAQGSGHPHGRLWSALGLDRAAASGRGRPQFQCRGSVLPVPL